MNFLQGKKTYIVALLVGALAAGKSLGYVDDETYKMLLGLLNSLGLATLAAKMNRVDNNTKY